MSFQPAGCRRGGYTPARGSQRPAVASGGPRLGEHLERRAEICLGAFEVDLRRLSCADRERERGGFTTFALLGQLRCAVEQLERLLAVTLDAFDPGELRQREAFELRSAGLVS